MPEEIPTGTASEPSDRPLYEPIAPKRTWRQKLFGNKMLRVSGVYVLGSVIQQASNFLLIPLWTRFLTPEDYGITGTLMAAAGLLGHLVGLGLHGAAARFHFDGLDDAEKQRRTYSTIWAFQLLFSVGFTLLLLLAGPLFWGAFTENKIPFFPFVPLMLLTVFATGLTNLPIVVLQTRQRAGAYVLVQYGKFILLTLSGVLLVVFLKWGALGWITSQAIASTAVAVLLGIYFLRNLGAWPLDWSIIKPALKFSLPLLPHGLAAWVLLASDRMILTYFDTPMSEVGLYTVGYTLGTAMFSVIAAFNQAWGPKYMDIMTRDPEGAQWRIPRIWSYFVVAVGSLCLFAILFCPIVVKIILPEKYLAASIYSGPIFFTYFLQGLYYFAGSPMFYFKAMHFIPIATVIAAAVNILLNLLLVPHFGPLAAAWTTVAGDSVLLLLVFVIGRRFQKISFPYWKLLTYILLLPTCYLLFSKQGVLNFSELGMRLLVLGGFFGLGIWMFLPGQWARIRGSLGRVQGPLA